MNMHQTFPSTGQPLFIPSTLSNLAKCLSKSQTPPGCKRSGYLYKPATFNRKERKRRHNEDLYELYSSPNIGMIKSGRMRWAEHVARTGVMRGAYRVLVGRPKENRPLWRPRRRWDNIEMDLQKVGWRGTDWIDLAQDRKRRRALVNAVMNLRVA